jgi:hypothetical protein
MCSRLVAEDVRDRIVIEWVDVLGKTSEDMKINERLRIDILNC